MDEQVEDCLAEGSHCGIHKNVLCPVHSATLIWVEEVDQLINFLPGCSLQCDSANLLVGRTLDETGDLTECPGSMMSRLGGVSNHDDFTNTGGAGSGGS